MRIGAQEIPPHGEYIANVLERQIVRDKAILLGNLRVERKAYLWQLRANIWLRTASLTFRKSV